MSWKSVCSGLYTVQQSCLSQQSRLSWGPGGVSGTNQDKLGATYNVCVLNCNLPPSLLQDLANRLTVIVVKHRGEVRRKRMAELKSESLQSQDFGYYF